MLMIVLRLAHIVTGALWVGMMWMMTWWVVPAVREVGPEGAKVMQGLQRRRLMMVMPLMALVTIAAGIWLMIRLGGGNPGAIMRSPMGKAYAWGATAAIVAFLIGVLVTRPMMMKAMKIAESRPTQPAEVAELERLRNRGLMLSKVVSILLLLALALMAVARYL